MNCRYNIVYALMMVAAVLMVACNKDEEIGRMFKPVITFDNESGIYTVKIGQELTLAPEIEYGEGASVEWSMDGDVVCRQRVWSAVWTVPGEFYALLTVTNSAGTAREEVRIDVVDKTPPTISIRMPEDGLKVLVGEKYVLSPRYQHDDMDGFAVNWYVAGDVVCTEREYEFCSDVVGVYHVRIVAENVDGVTEREFDVEVVDELPRTVRFLPMSSLTGATTRYTFVGRAVCLHPVVENIAQPHYSWTVDGEDARCASSVFSFEPEKAGEYVVTVNVDGVDASVTVVCVATSELSGLRPSTSACSAYSNKVCEWIPAPGQFIGETSSVGGMTADITTHELACRWAQTRLDSRKFVSLGAWGGYITVGFDHSITNGSAEYDFAIMGNAMSSSNEPGIVWVMQDVNGNGLPDDEWYELKGSEFAAPSTVRNYSATYYRPGGSAMDVEWTDCNGVSGVIAYLPDVHTQPSYYPAWIEQDAYTLYGPALSPRNTFDPVTGFWSNNPYDWGYADNIGSDNLPGGDTVDGFGQITGFKISNAVTADGKPVVLSYIDFIKVQTGAMTNSGRLGELSTEVCAFMDYSMIQ